MSGWEYQMKVTQIPDNANTTNPRNKRYLSDQLASA